MSVIILLAVGSDYNLLLVSRFKEEIHAGIKTGIIRSMAGTGAVVTSAGLVFAFTMMSMVVSDLIVVDTEDVLLIMPRERAQDVKKLLDELKSSGREGYL